MHIKSYLLLGVSALLTSTVLATPPSIKFCNNDDLNKAKACTTDVIMFDTCRPVPDSNHKGDGGSNFQVKLHPLLFNLLSHDLIRANAITT